jgi:ferric-chelate reductase (NADPH)
MDDHNHSETTTTTASGLETALHKLISRQVEVQSNEPIGAAFRLVTLAGASLKNRNWTPGDIVQVAFPGWESRAYTPLTFDRVRGSTQFLGYVHGNGPGSDWLASDNVGTQRFLVGPRFSVNLPALRRPALFFGDETSVSTAVAFRATPLGAQGVHFVFEVNATADLGSVLERFGLQDSSTLILREPHEQHLERLQWLLLEAFQTNAATHAVLTGRASSIKRLYKALRGFGWPRKQVTNLAYWALGRTGFSGVQS